VKELHAGRYLRLVVRNGWEFVERPGIHGIVLVVAVTPGNRLLLVEQWREAVAANVIELPAGLAGDAESPASEPLEEAARRELVEETGWDAATMERLTAGPPSAGVTSEIVTFFRARGVSKIGPGGGVEGEAITVHEVPLDAVEAFLTEREAEGTFVDPKVWAGLWFARRP
jgi:ADP-ribose pyrophosphatase